MKVVLLAGGFGTRISEESQSRPKPMVEIGGMPMLWHIMKGYSRYGYDEFIICAGYKQHMIKEWFADYFLHTSDVTFDFTRNGEVTAHAQRAERWKVTVVDTGLGTMTGGRIRRIQRYVGGEPFMLTYGDGVSDIDLGMLETYHRSHGRVATLTSVGVEQRFGILEIGSGGSITAFREKSDGGGSRINAGFMVMNPEIFSYLEGDHTVLEKWPMETLASMGELKSYPHSGYWQCMDTKREKDLLEELWAGGRAPWKVWSD
jgi:glucose-1-phosphate cytidylyltransferase